jgi:hypothetical protein
LRAGIKKRLGPSLAVPERSSCPGRETQWGCPTLEAARRRPRSASILPILPTPLGVRSMGARVRSMGAGGGTRASGPRSTGPEHASTLSRIMPGWRASGPRPGRGARHGLGRASRPRQPAGTEPRRPGFRSPISAERYLVFPGSASIPTNDNSGSDTSPARQAAGFDFVQFCYDRPCRVRETGPEKAPEQSLRKAVSGVVLPACVHPPIAPGARFTELDGV